MHASYNITNDKLKAWFDSRLSEEDYKRARAAGFQYWHGSKCFAAKWSPTAEDFLTSMGIADIQIDDQPDNVEARVERFAGYAESAERSAESSQAYLNERANTERRKQNAINSVEKNLDAARHWQDRIAGAIRNAQYKERPDVIARRIRGLEADRRKHQRDITIDPKVKPYESEGVKHFWVGHSRGGHWVTLEKLEQFKPWALRWIAHLDRRLEYENACLIAAGGAPEVLRPERKKAVQPKGVQATKFGIPEALGAAGFRPGFDPNAPLVWRLITKVNRRTIEIMQKQTILNKPPRYFGGKKEIYSIDGLKTRKEVQAEMPHLHDEYEELQTILARIEERKQQAQEVAA